MNSTQEVIANHIRRFREGNLEGVLDDFSPDPLLFTPAGLLKGRGLAFGSAKYFLFRGVKRHVEVAF